MPSLLLSLLFLAQTCTTPAQSTLANVESLRLPSLAGDIRTFHAPGYRAEAESTAEIFRASNRFFSDRLGVSREVTLAILDSASWTAITPIPYGLPFVSGPPYIVCIPATADNPLSETLAAALPDSALAAWPGVSRTEIVQRFVALIGFHELGHIYATAMGAEFPNRWTFEFAATFLAAWYLDQEQPEALRLWVRLSRILVDELTARHTSLADFERLYVRVGIENYAWYQVVFLLRVAEVYRTEGADFVARLRTQEWPADSDTRHVASLEALAPGFMPWARQYGLLDGGPPTPSTPDGKR